MIKSTLSYYVCLSSCSGGLKSLKPRLTSSSGAGETRFKSTSSSKFLSIVAPPIRFRSLSMSIIEHDSLLARSLWQQLELRLLDCFMMMPFACKRFSDLLESSKEVKFGE